MNHTPDEIKEMRRALAELCGLHFANGKPYLLQGCFYFEESWQPDIKWNHTGMVVEKLRARWRDTALGSWIFMDEGPLGWRVACRSYNEGKWNTVLDERADTLPSAIAWAAFEAVKGETDG